MINKKNPKIIGDGFELVPFEIKHLSENYLNWLRDIDINKFLVKPNKDITKKDAKKFCEDMMHSSTDFFLAIITQENIHIGNVRIGPIDYDSKVCKFSMMIGDKNYHGKGYGTSIVSSSFDYIFNKLNMDKITLDVIADNIPAVKIYKKNNMHDENTLRKKVSLDGRLYNLKTMSIYKS